MPRKKSALTISTDARRTNAYRARESEDKRRARLEACRLRAALARSNETEEQRKARLKRSAIHRKAKAERKQQLARKAANRQQAAQVHLFEQQMTRLIANPMRTAEDCHMETQDEKTHLHQYIQQMDKAKTEPNEEQTNPSGDYTYHQPITVDTIIIKEEQESATDN